MNLRFFLIAGLISSAVTFKDHPVVEIDNGKLLGVFKENYYSFYGIPYSKPPVGELRFEAPQPFDEKWEGLRIAQQPPKCCVQQNPLLPAGRQILGLEDCLYLNIHTPSFKTEELLPVIFNIHGGGFMFGCGTDMGEITLMQHSKMVHVTFNYRLAHFGFLSTEDDQIAGNMGLKDQRLALEWVKANIQKFGGDPNRILIAGFSAGAASVEYQLLKPGIENLVKAAVAFSGSAALMRTATNNRHKKQAAKVAQLLNCPTDNSSLIKSCLKEHTALDIISTLKELEKVESGLKLLTFTPVVESKLVSDAFMTETIESAAENGKIPNIPLLTTWTAEDGIILLMKLWNDLKTNPSKITIESIKKYEFETDREDTYYEKLISELKNDQFESITRFMTQSSFANPINNTIALRRKHSNASTYSYCYSNPPDQSLGNVIFGNKNINFGTTHGDDVFLMFNYDARDQLGFRDDEIAISEKFIKMIESFIVEGKPKFGDIELPENKPGEVEKAKYLKIYKDKTEICTFN